MKKNGFTLVEIIAVIVILSVIMVLVVPSITDSSKNTREKTYEAKIESFETAAELYGQDNYKNIITLKNKTAEELAQKLYCDTYSTNSNIHRCTLQINRICRTYIKEDSMDGATCVIEDPRNPSNNLKDCKVTISIDASTKKVTASYNTEGNKNC